MRGFLRNLFIFLFMFLITGSAQAAIDPVKIDSLIFDEADGIIFVKSRGIIDSDVTIQKGYLKNPDRIYVDINNAILTSPKKAFRGKYSLFDEIKYSQFALEPKIVRLVFEYGKKLDLSAFQVYKNKNGIYIKTKKKFIKSDNLKTVYANGKSETRTAYYNGAKMEEVSAIGADEIIQIENAPKNEIMKEIANMKPASVSKIASNYYIDTIIPSKGGVMISGLGKLSLIPSFTLENPSRLIIDIDDTIVASELRNKTFQINENETIKIGQNTQSIARLVIQGQNAKDYRGIVSPDSKSLFLTNKKNIITAKMTENNANLENSEYNIENGNEKFKFTFSDSVSFTTFEENNNLYIDINNLNTFQNEIIAPVAKSKAGFTTTRLALDKLRITIPEGAEKKNINLKTSPDNTAIEITMKPIPKAISAVKANTVLIPLSETQNKKQGEISNFYTVVIDAGHGGSDVGATRDNIYEKDITLEVAKLVQKKLNKKKVKTYMIREKDKTVSLSERSDYSNEKKPDVFVSVHVNSSTNDEIIGVETHWYKEDSYKYAQYVHKEMAKKIKNWKTIDRGLFKSQFYVINHTEAPAILCEIGFISNENERKELIKEKRQDEIADAIAEGIYSYLKARK